MNDVVRGMPTSSDYDNVAHHQIYVQMPAQHRNGSLYRGNKLMMDMVSGQVALF